MESLDLANNNTPAPNTAQRKHKLEKIKIDSAVALKVVKHARDNLNRSINGIVLGLDFKGTLEITECFPIPLGEDNNPMSEEAEEAYIGTMHKQLQRSNADEQVVGAYLSAYTGELSNDSLIDTQYGFQEAFAKSVTLVYEPLKSDNGLKSLRAFRISDNFFDLMKEGQYDDAFFKKYNVTFADIWEEIPVEITKSLLSQVFMMDHFDTSSMDFNSNKLVIPSRNYLEKNMSAMCGAVDDLIKEQTQMRGYQVNVAKHQSQIRYQREKRKQENEARVQRGEMPIPFEEPPKLQPLNRYDSLLISNQLHTLCHQVNELSALNFGRSYLLGGLNKRQ